MAAVKDKSGCGSNTLLVYIMLLDVRTIYLSCFNIYAAHTINTCKRKSKKMKLLSYGVFFFPFLFRRDTSCLSRDVIYVRHTGVGIHGIIVPLTAVVYLPSSPPLLFH